MSKAKMDYLWAPKDEKVVSGLLDHLGITKVGKSDRYPTGVKYDAMIAIADVIKAQDEFASMVASQVDVLQGGRKQNRGPSVDSIVAGMQSGKISEADLKTAMKKAGLL
jgi:hypothetical protein|tara:strand:- start:873 stop:1199 length:327 start_codon:yes stop_codon:yes gene_type:complete